MDRHVIVICEECGRKYRVDPDRILGRAAGFSCRACGHRIRVVKPEPSLPRAAEPGTVDRERPDPPAAVVPAAPPFRSSGLSLGAKVWLLGFIVPAALLAVAGLLLLEPFGAMPGLDPNEGRWIGALLMGGLFIALVAGLGFGLRLVGRIARLAAAAEQAASDPVDTVPAPASGDDLDRVAAAVRDLNDQLRHRRATRP